MTETFSWIPLYTELAKELSQWQDRQADLLAFLENLRQQGYVITSFMDKGEDGERFPLTEIDPFTFYGVFTRGLRDEERVRILKEIKVYFHLQSALPQNFLGIPVLNNMKSWFFSYQADRRPGDVGRLWHVFQLALGENPLNDTEFLNAFDEALTVRSTNVNLTMGLYWICPDVFISLDSVNRRYLDISLPSKGLNAKFYLEILSEVSRRGLPFAQISYNAWLEVTNQPTGQPATKGAPILENVNYWLVGAYWDGNDPPDQTGRFLAEGIWENGYKDRYLDEVNSMKIGDRIGIKAATTQRLDLPFDGRNKTVSRLIIKAIGTIVANRNDGRTVEVEWDTGFVEKNWYFYTARNTVWHVMPPGKNVWKEAAKQLIAFVWYGQGQDYDWFTREWWDKEKSPDPENCDEIIETTPYSVDDVVASGAFLDVKELNLILDRLSEKKALILQGPPGVGKTFLARKIAYALMGEKDNNRLQFVQFHQSYSYDDFVRGYRPLPGQAGTFGLKNGVFFEFCEKATQDDPERAYVFIIDEINRGNLSQIFGELLMLVENDKRGEEFSVPLVYRDSDDERFFIPSNLYLIGLMNLADRSLAMVDYALRRRFAFITLDPQFEAESFETWLLSKSMDAGLVQHIIERMSSLNRIIREDPLLGENYQIGHSYFCPRGDQFEGLDLNWYESIVKTEIIPLIKEYWFDNPQKAGEFERELLI